MGLKIFLNYYDGDYGVQEFGKLEIIEGKPYYEGKLCKIGDEFKVPTKMPRSVNIKFVPMTTILGYCKETKTWHFWGFENYNAEDIYCRKV